MNCTTDTIIYQNAVIRAALAATLLGLAANPAKAATEFSSRATFESALVSFIVDDYEATGYQTGDVIDGPIVDVHSNANMSAIFGETQYTTTGFTDNNLIVFLNANHYYCAGCNGSYETDFTATSIGTSSGVFGVGLDVVGSAELRGTHAFVTYGDDSTEDFTLPQVDAFWGITSDLLIKTIHFGLANGGINTSDDQRMAMDNLTIGTNVPEPGTAVLLLGVLGSIQWVARRRIANRVL